MKKSILSLTFILALSATISAQNSVFSVILNKGDNSVKKGELLESILIGSKLDHDDILHVQNSGYIALVHEGSGASLELTEGGDFKVLELESKLQDRPSTVLAKYGKFLMKKLNPDEKGNQNLNVTGAVERGEIGLIEVDLPKVNDLFGNQVIVSWKQTDDIQDYIITIKDKLDDLITEKHVKGTSYSIDLSEGLLRNEEMIIISVHAQSNDELRSPDFGIKKLDKNKSEVIGNEFENLKMVASSDNVVDKLLIASFFEENQLFVDAITYYYKAQSISPDPDGFNKLYTDFLIRNGLNN